MDLEILFAHPSFQCNQHSQIGKNDTCLEDCIANTTRAAQATDAHSLAVDAFLPGRAVM